MTQDRSVQGDVSSLDRERNATGDAPAASPSTSYLGRLFLFCYRASIRLRCKLFSLLVSGAFAHFGSKTVLMYPIRLDGEERIAIGDHVFIGPGSWLQTLPDAENRLVAITVGSGTSVAGACVISAVRSVTLEENVLLARNVYISDHIHKYADTHLPVMAQGVEKVQRVLIKRGAWLGQNVVVCPGVTIGIGAVVGANSVVTKDVPDYCVAAGAPARVVKEIARRDSIAAEK
jgi:acetyltransferase-like isoleucine patch superfamily enzyme